MKFGVSTMTDEQLEQWELEMRSRAPIGEIERKPRAVRVHQPRKPMSFRTKEDIISLLEREPIDLSSSTLLEDAKARTDRLAAQIMEQRR